MCYIKGPTSRENKHGTLKSPLRKGKLIKLSTVLWECTHISGRVGKDSLHPRRLTRNIRIEVWQMIFLNTSSASTPPGISRPRWIPTNRLGCAILHSLWSSMKLTTEPWPYRLVKLIFDHWIIPGTQVTQNFSMVKYKTKDQRLRGKNWSNYSDLLATWAPNFDR